MDRKLVQLSLPDLTSEGACAVIGANRIKVRDKWQCVELWHYLVLAVAWLVLYFSKEDFEDYWQTLPELMAKKTTCVLYTDAETPARKVRNATVAEGKTSDLIGELTHCEQILQLGPAKWLASWIGPLPFGYTGRATLEFQDYANRAIYWQNEGYNMLGSDYVERQIDKLTGLPYFFSTFKRQQLRRAFTKIISISEYANGTDALDHPGLASNFGYTGMYE